MVMEFLEVCENFRSGVCSSFFNVLAILVKCTVAFQPAVGYSRKWRQSLDQFYFKHHPNPSAIQLPKRTFRHVMTIRAEFPRC